MRYATRVEEIENYDIMGILYFVDEINKFDISFFGYLNVFLKKIMQSSLQRELFSKFFQSCCKKFVEKAIREAIRYCLFLHEK